LPTYVAAGNAGNVTGWPILGINTNGAITSYSSQGLVAGAGIAITSSGSSTTITNTVVLPQSLNTTSTPTWDGAYLSSFLCIDSLYYSTGTANQSGAYVYGSATTNWTTPMIGGLVIYPNGFAAFILEIISPNRLTVTPNLTVASGTYQICYDGVQSTSGNLGVNTTFWLNGAFITGTPVVQDSLNATQAGTTVTILDASQAESVKVALVNFATGGVIIWPLTNQACFVTASISNTQWTCIPSQNVAPAPFVLYIYGVQSYGGGMGINGPLVLQSLPVGSSSALVSTDGEGTVSGVTFANGQGLMMNNAGAFVAGTFSSPSSTITIGTTSTGKTFDVNSALSISSLTLTNPTNQISLGTTTKTIITAPAPGTTQTTTIPDQSTNLGTSSSFMLTTNTGTYTKTGTWTPVMGDSLGNTLTTTGNSFGWFSIIGDTTFFWTLITWSALPATQTHQLQISLPSTAMSGGNNFRGSVTINYAGSITYTGMLSGGIANSANAVTFLSIPSGSAPTAILISACSASGTIEVSGNYRTA
jgi:hypothetical protein